MIVSERGLLARLGRRSALVGAEDQDRLRLARVGARELVLPMLIGRSLPPG